MTLRRNASYECRLTASHLPCSAFLATKYTIDGHSINSLNDDWDTRLNKGVLSRIIPARDPFPFLLSFLCYLFGLTPTAYGLSFPLDLLLHSIILTCQTLIETLTLLATHHIIITP